MDNATAFHVLSLRSSEPQVRSYKKRSTHVKQKSGCVACKAKRVKCDESRPRCMRCRRNGRICSFGGDESRSSPHVAAAPATTSALHTRALAPISPPSADNGTPSAHLIQHVQRHGAAIFQMPGSDEIVAVSRSWALVRHAMLAITACHLRHVSPADGGAVVAHRVAEHFHLCSALHDFQGMLDAPPAQLGSSGAAALMLGALLLNILAWALPDTEGCAGRCEERRHGGNHDDDDDRHPSRSWVFSPRDDRLDWLALQAGLRPLMISRVAYLDEMRQYMRDVFLGRADDGKTARWPYLGLERGLDTIPETWIRIFELAPVQPGSTSCDIHSESDVFRLPVVMLTQLREFAPVRSNVFFNLWFLGKVHPQFRTRLFRRDERALWILGYWLGLMCRVRGVWWQDQRVRRDYRAIGLWLDQLRLIDRPGTEGECWREMMAEYKLAPVYACGVSG